MQLNEEEKRKYWDGPFNKTVRIYFYLMRGLDTFNQFKYLAAAIWGFCWLLKVRHALLMAGIFLGSCIVLAVFGWLMVHRIAKVIEFLSVEFSSHWAKKNYDMMQEQIDLLKALKALNALAGGKAEKNGE